MKNTKKIMAGLICLLMIVSMFPTVVLANDGVDETELIAPSDAVVLTEPAINDAEKAAADIFANSLLGDSESEGGIQTSEQGSEYAGEVSELAGDPIVVEQDAAAGNEALQSMQVLTDSYRLVVESNSGIPESVGGESVALGNGAYVVEFESAAAQENAKAILEASVATAVSKDVIFSIDDDDDVQAEAASIIGALADSEHGQGDNESEISDGQLDAQATSSVEDSTTEEPIIEAPSSDETIEQSSGSNASDAETPAVVEIDYRAAAGNRPLIAVIDTGSNTADAAVSVIDTDGADDNGHGTRMTDLIREHSIEVSPYILSIKALNYSGAGNMSDVYAAVQYAISQRVDYINLSISANDSDDMVAFKSAIQTALDAGIVVVASAGNAGGDASELVPANIEGVVTCGAINENNQVTSNYGSCVNVYVKASSSSQAAAMMTGMLAQGYDVNIASGYGENVVFPNGSEKELVVLGMTFIASYNDNLFHTNAYGGWVGLWDSAPRTAGGTHDSYTYQSAWTGNWDTQRCWVPNGYSPDDGKMYDLIILSYGAGEDNSNYVFDWDSTDIDGIVQYKIDHGLMRPTILAAFNPIGSDNLLFTSDLHGLGNLGYDTFEEAYNSRGKFGSYTQNALNDINSQNEAMGQSVLNALHALASKYPNLYVAEKWSGASNCACSELEMRRHTGFVGWSAAGHGIGYIDNIAGWDIGNYAAVAYTDSDYPQKVWGNSVARYITVSEDFRVSNSTYHVSASSWNDAHSSPAFRSGVLNIIEMMNQLQTCDCVPVNRTGQIRVEKASSKPSVTNGRSRYSLEGAQFQLYNDAACTDAVANTTMTIGADGKSETIDVPQGDYYLKEIAAPRGYKLSTDIKNVTIAANEETIVNFTNEPDSGFAKIHKVSDNPAMTDGNACYTLAGAVYTAYADVACTQLLQDVDGQVVTFTTDANGDAVRGKIPFCDFYVKETTAPRGYALSDTVQMISVTTSNMTADVAARPANDFVDRSSADPALFSVQKMNESGTRIGPTLAGAQFTINYYDGFYEASNLPATPKRTWVIETQWNSTIGEYIARLDNAHIVSGSASSPLYTIPDTHEPTIPLGTVTVRENKAPAGYTERNPVYTVGGTNYSQDLLIYQIKDDDQDGAAIAYYGNTAVDGKIIQNEKRLTPGNNALVVKKTVTGNRGSHDEYFEITIEMSNLPNDRTYTLDLSKATADRNPSSFKSDAAGKAKITVWLQHGQQIGINEFPALSHYKIYENKTTLDNEGYTTKVNNADGYSVEADMPNNTTPVTVSFTNRRIADVPTRFDLNIGLAVLPLVAVLGIVFLIMQNKRKKTAED